jgi:hypothetical protein
LDARSHSLVTSSAGAGVDYLRDLAEQYSYFRGVYGQLEHLRGEYDANLTTAGPTDSGSGGKTYAAVAGGEGQPEQPAGAAEAGSGGHSGGAHSRPHRRHSKGQGR